MVPTEREIKIIASGNLRKIELETANGGIVSVVAPESPVKSVGEVFVRTKSVELNIRMLLVPKRERDVQMSGDFISITAMPLTNDSFFCLTQQSDALSPASSQRVTQIKAELGPYERNPKSYYDRGLLDPDQAQAVAEREFLGSIEYNRWISIIQRSLLVLGESPVLVPIDPFANQPMAGGNYYSFPHIKQFLADAVRNLIVQKKLFFMDFFKIERTVMDKIERREQLGFHLEDWYYNALSCYTMMFVTPKTKESNEQRIITVASRPTADSFCYAGPPFYANELIYITPISIRDANAPIDEIINILRQGGTPEPEIEKMLVAKAVTTYDNYPYVVSHGPGEIRRALTAISNATVIQEFPFAYGATAFAFSDGVISREEKILDQISRIDEQCTESLEKMGMITHQFGLKSDDQSIVHARLSRRLRLSN